MFYLINTFRQLSIRTSKPRLLTVLRYSTGPPPEKLKAIPFSQHVKAAEKVT